MEERSRRTRAAGSTAEVQAAAVPPKLLLTYRPLTAVQL